jgi:putative ABC transport system substrate-binding protein
MRRREFIAGLGGAAVWPVAAQAQLAGKLPTIGFLDPTSSSTQGRIVVSVFSERLRELGWFDGRNIQIEVRLAEGRHERYAEIAAEFVRLRVDVIVTYSVPAIMAAKHATSAIPIVFASSGDPVGNGLVASLAHPGGNLTGMSNQQADLVGKRIELLREVVPLLRRLAIMTNMSATNAVQEQSEVETTARGLGLEAIQLQIRSAADIEPAFAGLKDRADALYVVLDPLLNTNRVQINTRALGARLPVIHAVREAVVAAGLMSYGPNAPDLYRRAAEYVDKILRGAKPADLPVQQPVKFDLVINLTTAQTLGLIVPPTLLARADEVIE